MRNVFSLFAALLWALASASAALTLPSLGYEAGPGIQAPLGGWSKALGAGPAFALRVVHPWRPKVAFGLGVGLSQLRGKADRDLIYRSAPVTARAGYRFLRMRSEQDLWVWAGAGAQWSQTTLSGGKETSSDPVAEAGLTASFVLAPPLRIFLETAYKEVFAPRQHGRGVGLGLGLRVGR